MKQIFSLTIICLLLFLTSCEFLREKGILGGRSRKQDIALMLARQDSIRVADSIRNAAQKNAETEEQAVAPVSEQPVRNLSETVAERRFNIVVGSFLTDDFAKARADEYIAKGFKPVIIINHKNNNKLVVAEAYDSFDKAVARLKEFRSQVNPDAWLYERR